MDTEINKKIELKDKLINFYNSNKVKIYIFFIIVIMVSVLIIFLKVKLEKKNEKIAENYVRAGILLNSGNKEDSLDIYENIIISKNKFYSVLALNTILEKNLTIDEKKINGFFETVEEALETSDQKDLLRFKKALYLLKNGENSKGNEILKSLIDKNSLFKSLSEEVITK
tara:strand:- start:307 stop:816 length:510 start_codon:yes stop_codon:yes gene_type:complete